MYSFNRLSLRTIWVSCIWYDSQGPLRGLGSMLEASNPSLVNWKFY